MYNGLRLFNSTLAAIVTVALALPPVSLARERVTCESRNYRYNYCRVDTGNRVRLKERISRAPCVEGRSWGYDKRGVWVDDGCSAEFEVGKDKDKDNDGKGGALGLGAAAVGAAVLGGLLGGGAGQSAGSGANPDYYPGDASYPPASAPYPSAGAPSWAIGVFRGYDRVYNMNVELTINPNGSVQGYAQNRPLQGSISGNQLRLGDATFYVEPDSQGFRAVQASDARNQVRYLRIR